MAWGQDKTAPLSEGSGGVRVAHNTVLVVVLSFLLTTPTLATNSQNGLEESPLTVVYAVESGQVLLPCDVSPPISTDDTILVLFYHGAIGTPIYSIDGRSGSIKRAPHWSDEGTLGTRAYFNMASDPPGLVLQSVQASDHAEYRCRVDFRSSPTRNVRIQLEVIVPPKRIKILSAAGLEVSGVIGPYPVSASVALECQVDSGRPRPNVSWFHEEKLLDDVIEVRRGEMTSNTLRLSSLTRDYLYRVLTCQASNSNLSVPLAATVTLDMSFPPLDVRILGTVESLSEGERYAIVCESSGSRPTATITWWKDGLLMTDTKSQVFHEGNVSRSTLYLTPTLADHDAYISCRAKNPMVPAAVLEDTRKLNVHYTPRLSLAAGHNLDMEDIKEGDDVYFECGIKANPRVFKVQWFHNGDELTHNVSAGVIQSNQSLVLQRVTRPSSGQYTCSATNLHGIGSSNAVQLSVKFAPLCREGQKVVYGGGKHEELNITCSVEAHPEPTSFRWAFNSSSEVVDIPSSKFWVVGNGKSQASYTPRTHLDYGSLLCWANNDVGRQLKPCIYHIIHASPPEPVNNCTVENVTSTGASVRCLAGWDGGLAQTFTLSVTPSRPHSGTRDKKKEAPRVLANTSTSPKPEFSLTGLEPGTEYILTIMGVNKKGESEPIKLAIFTLKDVAEKRTSPGVGALALTPILAVLLGVLASLLLMALVIALVVRSRRPRARKPEVKMVYDKGSAASVPLRGPEDPASDDQNPDLIPVNDDHQVKDLTQDYTPESLPTTDLQLQQPQPQQQQLSPPPPMSPKRQEQQQSPTQPKSNTKEYHQGHDSSFYINPGTLLRQECGQYQQQQNRNSRESEGGHSWQLQVGQTKEECLRRLQERVAKELQSGLPREHQETFLREFQEGFPKQLQAGQLEEEHLWKLQAGNTKEESLRELQKCFWELQVGNSKEKSFQELQEPLWKPQVGHSREHEGDPYHLQEGHRKSQKGNIGQLQEGITRKLQVRDSRECKEELLWDPQDGISRHCEEGFSRELQTRHPGEQEKGLVREHHRGFSTQLQEGIIKQLQAGEAGNTREHKEGIPRKLQATHPTEESFRKLQEGISRELEAGSHKEEPIWELQRDFRELQVAHTSEESLGELQERILGDFKVGDSKEESLWELPKSLREFQEPLREHQAGNPKQKPVRELQERSPREHHKGISREPETRDSWKGKERLLGQLQKGVAGEYQGGLRRSHYAVLSGQPKKRHPRELQDRLFKGGVSGSHADEFALASTRF
ncbi:uncharacterized protein [Panulirus ornatus]|uniref:uncharacterized protein isoform X2 n=1 Tax=Panulirus ornatus TaxID=150431 RepID=UPI003A87393B